MEHQLARDQYHHRWERDLEPTLEIASGDVVDPARLADPAVPVRDCAVGAR